jgi:hypothetical protein
VGGVSEGDGDGAALVAFGGFSSPSSFFGEAFAFALPFFFFDGVDSSLAPDDFFFFGFGVASSSPGVSLAFAFAFGVSSSGEGDAFFFVLPLCDGDFSASGEGLLVGLAFFFFAGVGDSSG